MRALEFVDLPGWTFVCEEVSQGAFVARGTDLAGRSVMASGIDGDEVLTDCRRSAAALPPVAARPPM